MAISQKYLVLINGKIAFLAFVIVFKSYNYHTQQGMREWSEYKH